MSPFVLPWSVILLPLLVVTILFFREVLIVFRFPRFHPEHKIAIFNSIVLLGLLVSGAYGVYLLVLRDADFKARFPRYPSSRYAPERELLDGTGNRIYVTQDQQKQVVEYYSRIASSSGYLVVLDEEANSNGKMMITYASSTFFLTAQKEGAVTVLYYSESGEIKKVDR